jgi:hypothetical protein
MDMPRKVEIFRARFHGRQESYGRARKVMDGKGKQRTVYSPVCDNYMTDGCHIRKGTGIPCRKCENQLLDPVSDLSVQQHITGHHMHNFCPVLDEGMMRFGAVDFDLKPGKEAEGYTFFEVQQFCDLLTAQGIAYGIARSTTAGYHVYFFFHEPYLAPRFRAVIYKLFGAAGFEEYLKKKIKIQLPEIFPKQDYLSSGQSGNSVTPPMLEPLMMKGKKCWVDGEDRMIGENEDGEGMIEAQWRYLEELPWTDPAVFDKLIEKFALKVDDVATLKQRAESASLEGLGQGVSRPVGHVEKVLYGCEAFRILTRKILDHGHEPNHEEGMALWDLCINTVDGKDWFRDNVKTWGRDQTELAQLEYSISNNYRPHNCQKMQEKGVCPKPKGVYCAEAAPKQKGDPTATEGVLEDLQPAKKKLHNPYRYAFTEGADLLHALIKEADQLLELPAEDPDASGKKEQKIRELARRAQVLEKPKLRDFKGHVDKLQKPLKIPKNRVAPIFKEAGAEHFERAQDLLKEDAAAYEYSSFQYRKRYGEGKYGYYQITKGKDSFIETLLIEADIIIKEERYYADEGDVSRTVYKGVVVSAKGEKPFELDTDLWASDVEFQKFFTRLIGSSFSPVRKQLEHIKQAALGWCLKRGLTTQVSSLMTQGFYEDHYLMPSVTVDANGIRPTSPGVLEIGHKDVVKNLDWKILDDDEFRRTLRHIKDDFLTAWPAEWTYIGLAHVFRPLVRSLMGWSNYPTLFYDGLTGVGKSELTKTLQQFWGKFPSLVNLTVTQKYLEEMAHEFNDACLVLDDFKGLTHQQKAAVLNQIQYGYDGSTTGKLKRDSTARKARKNRATLIMSGEGFIQHQASVVARTILVEVDRFDPEKTEEAFARCLTMSKNYSGITPRFLHWMMGRDKELMMRGYENDRAVLRRLAKDRQNASRIAENLAANRLTWLLFTMFMQDSMVISPSEREELDRKHWTIIQTLYGKMVNRCEEEQESMNFLTILVSHISSGAFRIEGFPVKGQIENPRAVVIGYLPKPTDPKVVYLFPDAVINEVNNTLQRQGTTLSKRSVARQLQDQKILVDADPQRLSKTVRRGSTTLRVWAIDSVALQLFDGNPTAEEVESKPVVTLRPGVQAFRDGEGYF